MADNSIIHYSISDPLELNLSYMPFIKNGGLFVPTNDPYHIGDPVIIELQIPTKKENIMIEGKIVWITPSNTLHHVLPGIGIQFTGMNALSIRNEIEGLLDKTVEVGGYTYGITEESRRDKKK